MTDAKQSVPYFAMFELLKQLVSFPKSLLVAIDC